jgi:hypothetical protein
MSYAPLCRYSNASAIAENTHESSGVDENRLAIMQDSIPSFEQSSFGNRLLGVGGAYRKYKKTDDDSDGLNLPRREKL